MTTYQIQLRHDTAANWTTNNPIMASGEFGHETDTKKFKIGDGVTAWNSLAYDGAKQETLTNKTISLGSNTISGTTAQFNAALTDGDFATLAGAEALTNKTISNSSATLNLSLIHI